MAGTAKSSRAELREVDCVFDVPNWLEHLGASVTFQSKLVALSRADGEALLAAACVRKQVLALESIEPGDDTQGLKDNCSPEAEPIFSEGGVLQYLSFFERLEGELDDADFQDHKMSEEASFAQSRHHVAERFSDALPSPEIRNRLTAMGDRIQDAMQALHGEVASDLKTRRPGFFVRLSSRSPKDAAGVREVSFLEEALKQRVSQKTLNGRFGLFCDLFLRGMRVETGLEALHLLLASKRVVDDILQAVEAEDQFNVPYDLSFVVRPWSDGVRDDAEFRGFVSNDGQLVAISQYSEYFYQPELWEHQEAIAQALVKFVEEALRPRLLGTRFLPCVVDLVILQNAGLHEPFNPHGAVRVVELNPANERTSTALFEKTEVYQWVLSETTLKDFRLATQLNSQDGRFLQDRLNEAQQRWKEFQVFRDALS